MFYSGFPRSGKSQGKVKKFKVREKSGNFKLSQGNLKYLQMSGKSQGIPELEAEGGEIWLFNMRNK